MNNSFRIAIIIIALLLGINLSCLADKSNSQSANAREFFKEDPAGIFDLIPKSQRLDMLDYFDSNMAKEVNNAFDGQSRLYAASADYLKVALSPAVTVELWVPENSSMIIANYTYQIPATDGNIKVYSPSGLPIKSNWKSAGVADFILKTNKKDSSLTKSEILALADFPVIYYTLNPETASITAHLNIKEQLSEEDYNKLAPYFKDTITYKVNPRKGSFSTAK